MCDPDQNLPHSVFVQLDNLLVDLQGKVACECKNKCVRGEGLTNKYIGMIISTLLILHLHTPELHSPQTYKNNNPNGWVIHHARQTPPNTKIVLNIFGPTDEPKNKWPHFLTKLF